MPLSSWSNLFDLSSLGQSEVRGRGTNSVSSDLQTYLSHFASEGGRAHTSGAGIYVQHESDAKSIMITSVISFSSIENFLNHHTMMEQSM